MNLHALALLALLSPATALAQTPAIVSGCDDWRSAAQMLAEPWEDNTRLYAEGAVRFAVIDTGEPAAGSFHLLILSPPTEAEPEVGQCKLLSLDESMGFAGLTIAKAEAQYDPAKGLTVTVPATRWLPDTDTYTDAKLSVTLNQATGAIAAQLD